MQGVALDALDVGFLWGGGPEAGFGQDFWKMSAVIYVRAAEGPAEGRQKVRGARSGQRAFFEQRGAGCCPRWRKVDQVPRLRTEVDVWGVALDGRRWTKYHCLPTKVDVHGVALDGGRLTKYRACAQKLMCRVLPLTAEG